MVSVGHRQAESDGSRQAHHVRSHWAARRGVFWPANKGPPPFEHKDQETMLIALVTAAVSSKLLVALAPILGKILGPIKKVLSPLSILSQGGGSVFTSVGSYLASICAIEDSLCPAYSMVPGDALPDP